MSSNEQGITLLLAASLLGVAVYFGRQQLKSLRGLGSPTALGAGDRVYQRRQATRRLTCSALMILFAVMLFGWMFLGAQYHEVRQQIDMANVDPPAPPSDEQKAFLRLVTFYWIGALFILMVLLAFAAMDFWATVRYGLGQHRQLMADRRAMLQEHMERHKHEGNGFQKP